jgi:DNA repair exonuclease SbcCD ATPase subunit
MRDRITRLEALEKRLREYNHSLKFKKQELVQINAEISSQGDTEADREMNEAQHRLREISAEINAISGEVSEYTRDIEHLQFIDQTLLPSSAFRTQVLVKYLHHISQILSVVTPIIFSDVTVGLAVNQKATGIDIEITRKGKPIEYKQLSGGEKRRLDIVIILAFQRFLMEASGVRTNLVVFDEPFDGLDAGGVDAVMNCMDALFGDEVAVYVISHNDDIKTRFDSVVRVVKEAGVSHIAA